jgi:BNR/Asp-box repeat
MMKPNSIQFTPFSAYKVGNRSQGRKFALAFFLVLPLTLVFGQSTPSVSPLRDGAHDFDFNVGVWHTHIRRVLDPFSSSSDSIVLDGTVTVRKVWGGRAELEEIEADGPKGHWEGLSIFLYNPAAHQWSQSFLNSKMGDLGTPLIGEFHEGRADLFGQDTFKNQSILVRGVWSDIEANSHRYEESYSADGGKTWKFSFHADLTRDERVKEQDGTVSADPPGDSLTSDQRAFNFDLGTWKTHSRRLLHPLTGSQDWVEMDGTTNVQKVWGGKANLAEYDARGTGGHVTLLGLRWFNPEMHEWNLDFATPQVGTLGIPGVGSFKDGRGDFYDYEPIGGRSVLVRFSIWKISDDAAQSEQAFSDDGGKTWEVNWINHYTRVKGD